MCPIDVANLQHDVPIKDVYQRFHCQLVIIDLRRKWVLTA